MSLLRLKNPQAGVPGGANFFVHQTGYTEFGQTMGELRDRVIKHMNANGIPVPDNLSEVIEDQICRRASEQGRGRICKSTDPVVQVHQDSKRQKRGRCCGGS